ncbi:MAG TPA: hypothetical protein VK324_12130, partial [Tepidisphaeraceae bacterium]|nr:hypothetical protein [Tepidisphaeraceae bacterium]
MARRGSKAGAGKRTGGSLHGNGGGTAVSDREAASPPPPPGRADPGKQMVQTKSPNERPQPQVVPPVELAVPTSVEVPSQRVSDTPGPPPEEPGTLSPTAAAASPHVESVSESVGNSFVAERTPASTEGATGATPAVIEPTITSPSPAREAAVQPATPSSPPQPVPPPVKREPASESHQPPLLFEVAWEVCWQLGGIYTVLKSKAACMLDRWGDRYCMIGPYNPNTAAVEFEETPPDWHLRDVLQKLRESGITAYFGRWLIAGRPRVILLDYRGRYPSLDVDKYLLYQDHGIGTHAGDGEVNEVIAFGFCVQEFFRHFTNLHPGRPVCAHFHEWMGGVAVPRIAHLKIPVATVFTTHATLLGRYLAGDNPDFYNHLPFLNPEAEAQRYGIYPRYQIEKAAAHASTVFTTVSEVTNYEAEKLLGRTPDAILPNGLNIQRFAAPHEFQHLHRQYKEAIHEFVMGHFFPSQPFDLDRTLYFFTAGRYEYRNKGLDLFIEAMHRLNERLRGEPDRPTVVAFVVTKAPVRNINVGVLQSQSMFEDMKKWCGEMEGRIGRRMFLTAANGRLPKYEDLIDEDSMV